MAGGKIPVKKPRIPIDPYSNFLGNRAMGDWAEEALKNTINTQQKIHQALHYGDTNELATGDELFKEYYLSELFARLGEVEFRFAVFFVEAVGLEVFFSATTPASAASAASVARKAMVFWMLSWAS